MGQAMEDHGYTEQAPSVEPAAAVSAIQSADHQVQATEPRAQSAEPQVTASQMPESGSQPTTEPDYQAMMPEPVTAQAQPAPVLRDARLPQAEASAITPMVGPCPAQLTCNQQWLEAFAHLPLKGLERSLAKNAALRSRDGDTLAFELNSVPENFVTDERKNNWQQALRTLFGNNICLEIVSFSTHLETPDHYETALTELRGQQAQALLASDPVVQGLTQRFGAQINPESVEPLV